MSILSLMLSLAAAAAPATLEARTAAPELLSPSTPMLLYDLGEYDEHVRRQSFRDDLVPVKRWPEFGQAAAFAMLVIRDHLVTFVVDRTPGGHRLFFDGDADGDLTNNEPLQMQPLEQTDRVAAVIHTLAPPIGEPDDRPDPMQVRLSIVVDDSGGLPSEIHAHWSTVRSGRLTLDGRQVAFELFGDQGVYNLEVNRVAFDLDGDGEVDRDQPIGVSEGFVNLSGKSYGFEVDRRGDTLKLTPLDGWRPMRYDLQPGKFVPDFEFTTIDGKHGRLSDYRGKVVLLDFWGIWCHPCLDEVPYLVQAHADFNARGFEILGIDIDDALPRLREFMGHHGMSWPQIQETRNGRIPALFHVWGFPTYFLIDRQGKIVTTQLRGPMLGDLLADLMQEDGP